MPYYDTGALRKMTKSLLQPLYTITQPSTDKQQPGASLLNNIAGYQRTGTPLQLCSQAHPLRKAQLPTTARNRMQALIEN